MVIIRTTVPKPFDRYQVIVTAQGAAPVDIDISGEALRLLQDAMRRVTP